MMYLRKFNSTRDFVIKISITNTKTNFTSILNNINELFKVQPHHLGDRNMMTNQKKIKKKRKRM
jgi:hypothetical protein